MKFNTVHIEDWFSTDVPEKWEFEIEDDLITFYNAVNPKGVLQVSWYNIEESVAKKDEFAMQHLNNVIKQFGIIIETFTKKIIESPYCTFALSTGTTADNTFWKIWVVLFDNKMLL